MEPNNTQHPLDSVRKFMLTMRQSCPWKAELPDTGTRGLRHRLIDEENDELCNAETVESALDGICDLLYVVHGAAVAYGFTKEQVDGAFTEVHRSNMTKLWTNREVADLPLERVKELQVIRVSDDDSERPWLVKNLVGKVLKSPSYSPANLKPFLNP